MMLVGTPSTIHPYEILSRFLLSINRPGDDTRFFSPNEYAFLFILYLAQFLFSSITAGTNFILPEPDGKVPIDVDIKLADSKVKKLEPLISTGTSEG